MPGFLKDRHSILSTTHRSVSQADGWLWHEAHHPGWFNNRRLLEPFGNIPPAEAEERYYPMLDETPMAA